MKRHLPSLAALRAFDAAARHLSFVGASKELHVTPGAISRHIKGLEQSLRQSLFERHTRKIELTAFGTTYFASLAEAFDLIEQATLKALGTRSGLHVSIIPSTAAIWLMPRLAAFTEAHGDIEIDVHTSIKPVDFETEDIDVAIRVGSCPGQYYAPTQPRIPHQMVSNWQGVVAWPLCDEILVPVCSPALLESGPPIRSPSDLQYFPLFHVSGRETAWPDWFKAVGSPGIRGVGDTEFGHFFMALQAAVNGRGVALASTLLIDHYAGRKQLVTPLEQRVKSAGAYHVLVRERDAELSKVKIFTEWLTTQVKPPD